MAGARLNQPQQNQVLRGLPQPNEYYEWVMNEELRSPKCAYKLTELLGKGTFGIVLSSTRRVLRNVEVEDPDEFVAIKILRLNSQRVGDVEFRLLSRLRREGGHLRNCLRVIEAFNCNRHFCIVMEKLDINLSKFLSYRGKGTHIPSHITMDNLKIIAKDILTALRFLHEQNLIHTDLKTTNIALIDHHKSPYRVKVVDFGSTLTTPDLYRYRHRFNLQTMNYRSPEILLNYYPYNEAIDMWSLGVIMLELFSYERIPHTLLYNASCEYDLVRNIVECQGMPPKELLDGGNATTIYFCKTKNRQGWRLLTPREYIRTPHYRRLEQSRLFKPVFLTVEKPALMDGFGSVVMFKKPNYGGLAGKTDNENRSNFGDLVNRMLEVNPVKRITPSEALQHPFFASLSSVSIPITCSRRRR